MLALGAGLAGDRPGSSAGLGRAALVLVWAGTLAQLVAILLATFLLIRPGPYVNPWNILMTIGAAVPVALVLFVTWMLNYGHFHI